MQNLRRYISQAAEVNQTTGHIEYHAILHACSYLKKLGCEITYLDVDEYEKIFLDELRNAVRLDTILISIMTANNEIGTIEPIAEIGKIAHENGIFFIQMRYRHMAIFQSMWMK